MHSHKKEKNSLETQVILLIFSLELEISGVTIQNKEYIKTAKTFSFCEDLLIVKITVLANFCCYEYGANTSEAVQRMNTRTLELCANSLKQLIL